MECKRVYFSTERNYAEVRNTAPIIDRHRFSSPRSQKKNINTYQLAVKYFTSHVTVFENLVSKTSSLNISQRAGHMKELCSK